jgi:phosphodiesterase/alkaline phosphatase D-like protein
MTPCINNKFKHQINSSFLHSEFVAEESESLFWKFVTSTFGSGQQTPEALYKKSIEAAEALVVSDKAQLLKLALSLRTYHNT